MGAIGFDRSRAHSIQYQIEKCIFKEVVATPSKKIEIRSIQSNNITLVFSEEILYQTK